VLVLLPRTDAPGVPDEPLVAVPLLIVPVALAGALVDVPKPGLTLPVPLAALPPALPPPVSPAPAPAPPPAAPPAPPADCAITGAAPSITAIPNISANFVFMEFHPYTGILIPVAEAECQQAFASVLIYKWRRSGRVPNRKWRHLQIRRRQNIFVWNSCHPELLVRRAIDFYRVPELCIHRPILSSSTIHFAEFPAAIASRAFFTAWLTSLCLTLSVIDCARSSARSMRLRHMVTWEPRPSLPSDPSAWAIAAPDASSVASAKANATLFIARSC
jgi:hypothetical protein